MISTDECRVFQKFKTGQKDWQKALKNGVVPESSELSFSSASECS